MMHDCDNLALEDIRTAAGALAGIYERRGELATAGLTSARGAAGGPAEPDRGVSGPGAGPTVAAE